MLKIAFSSIVLALVAQAAFAGQLHFKPYTFKSDSGKTVSAQWGELKVPLKHGVHNGKTITLSFVRFKSTNPHPGYPIVYLAGGPGGSGIDAATGKRFPLFMALRKVADVIALDQRGTGASNVIPACTAVKPPQIDKPATRAMIIGYYRSAIEHCVAFWRQQGVDLSAYNTRQNALDLESLRKALGVKKLNLWGISYGSTLALAALKVMPERIDRVVLASPLAMTQTVRLPARTQDFLKRVDALTDGDLLGTMKTVLDRLAKNPAKVKVRRKPDEKPVTLTITRFVARAFTLPLLKDPDRLRYVPAMYHAMAANHFQPIAMRLYKGLRTPLSFDGMGLAVRAASCVSPERARRAEAQAKHTLLGNSFNFFTKLVRRAGIPHLDRDFCKPVHSDVPTLVLTGTLDGRTYPAGHAAILEGLSNGQEVVIENAGHDLFMSSPKVTTDIADFLSHQPVKYSTIKIPPPEFVIPKRAR
ncbi:MAG TPA: alpha/beta fold hydrolase [Gammaproteobacteria bacterium]|nr:alpha/beta fold hydrolase [Gammaproteobacteria bacterium]